MRNAATTARGARARVEAYSERRISPGSPLESGAHPAQPDEDDTFDDAVVTLGLARLAQSAPVSIALDTPTEQRTPLPFDLASKARSRRGMGRYRLLARIGEGGYGTVCEAEHVELKKRVALKVVTALRGHRTEIVERFTRESRRVSRLEDDHVVQIVDAGEDGSFGPFLVMELLHGDDQIGRA